MTIPEGVDPYSPYVPENAPELKVGMRVRVYFSGECGIRNAPSSPAGRAGIVAGHAAHANAHGKTGIIERDNNSGFEDHFEILMDESYSFEDKPYTSVDAAASELIPLEPSMHLQKE